MIRLQVEKMIYIMTENTKEFAYKIIPILVYLSQRRTNIYYSDLAKMIGYKSNRLGRCLGAVERIIKEVDKKSPSMNGYVINKKEGIPGSGFDTVFENYSKQKKQIQNSMVEKENIKASKYDWSSVLSKLEIEAYEPKLKLITKRKVNTSGGEGEKHRKLKEYIKMHPDRIGLKAVARAECEYKLPSGDSIDVFFKLKNGNEIAVEVKSAISDDNDILRGLYQCEKYRSVLIAKNKVQGNDIGIRSILVTERQINRDNLVISKILGSEIIEEFKI